MKRVLLTLLFLVVPVLLVVWQVYYFPIQLNLLLSWL